jgi:hypothetical protein
MNDTEILKIFFLNFIEVRANQVIASEISDNDKGQLTGAVLKRHHEQAEINYTLAMSNSGSYR